MFGLSSVIDCYGGTAREMAENRAAGREFSVKVGDVLVVEGFSFRIDPNPVAWQRGFPVLTLLK